MDKNTWTITKKWKAGDTAMACRHCAANEAVPGAKKVKYNPHNEGQVEIEAPMTRVE